MDAEEFSLNAGDRLPREDETYRIVVATMRDRKNKAVPAVRCFSLSSKDDNKLSVDWNRKTTPEESIGRLGASYKFNSTTFKSFDNREIYALSIDFLHTIDAVEEVVYDPIIVQNPQPGKINNPAHSLVVFTEAFVKNQAKEPETLLKIRDHAKDNRIGVDMKKVTEIVGKYRNGQ